VNKINFLLKQAHVGTSLSKKCDLALSVHGINFTEFMLIYYLNQTQGFTLSRIALAEKVALTASGVTRVLQPMEKNGLVEKSINPRDARQSLVVLTKAGQEIAQDAIKTIEYTAEDVLSLLDIDELSTLSQLLKKLKL